MFITFKMLTMEKSHLINLGIVAALTAVKKTLSMYESGMTSKDVEDMLCEIDQQLGVKQTELLLQKRA
jgi:hypothetical protein